MKKLSLKDAKKMLAALIDQAVAGEPTVITRDGRREAVLISFDEWDRISKRRVSLTCSSPFLESRWLFPTVPANPLARFATPTAEKSGRHAVEICVFRSFEELHALFANQD